MLLFLLDHFNATCPGRLAALEKITFRASACAMVSFLVALALGPRLIVWLRGRFREPIKGDSPHLVELQKPKQATPTMGGLFLVAGLIGGLLLFGDLGNVYVQVAVLVTLGLALVGLIDDLTKLFGTSNGITARSKLLGQLAVATLAAILLWRHHATLPGGLELRVPFLPDFSLSLGLGFIPLAVMVIVGWSNAVNLTDGLDGLAGGCLVFATGAMAVVAYVSGHAELASYLGVPRCPGGGELTVLAGAMLGGLMGFLWFNCHPAQVFMGDTGSLPLGGLLGLLAVATRQELLLVVVGGVFVVEVASVILQVGYFKWRKRRIFRCAPLHHHFQFLGWPETRIVVRFWIAAGLCAILGLVSLKLNIHDHPAPSTGRAADVSLASRGRPLPGINTANTSRGVALPSRSAALPALGAGLLTPPRDRPTVSQTPPLRELRTGESTSGKPARFSSDEAGLHGEERGSSQRPFSAVETLPGGFGVPRNLAAARQRRQVRPTRARTPPR